MGVVLIGILIFVLDSRSLSDLTPCSLISLGFSSFLINKKRNNISMLRDSNTSSPTGC